jgi:predicted RNA-binding Zn-ribbon protein involved in translation (DUF1610 family)
MTKQEAIETIRANYPPSHYMDLREALKIAIHNLKESEPVKPDAQGDGSFACGNCGETVGWEELNCGGISMVKYKYCPECGRKVKWDG